MDPHIDHVLIHKLDPQFDLLSIRTLIRILIPILLLILIHMLIRMLLLYFSSRVDPVFFLLVFFWHVLIPHFDPTFCSALRIAGQNSLLVLVLVQLLVADVVIEQLGLRAWVSSERLAENGLVSSQALLVLCKAGRFFRPRRPKYRRNGIYGIIDSPDRPGISKAKADAAQRREAVWEEEAEAAAAVVAAVDAVVAGAGGEGPGSKTDGAGSAW